MLSGKFGNNLIGEKTMQEIESEYLTDNQANYLIDLYLNSKDKKQ